MVQLKFHTVFFPEFPNWILPILSSIPARFIITFARNSFGGTHLGLAAMSGLEAVAFALGGTLFLVDVFDKSVQAYQIYSKARSLGEVSAHLVAKLLIEERRVIQWGDGVGINTTAPSNEENHQLDYRLRDNGPLFQSVLQALANIEGTLTDIDQLTVKYGLQVYEDDLANSQQPTGKVTLPLRMGRRSSHGEDRPDMSVTLKSIQDHSKKMQSSTSFRKKFRWALKDMSGFEMLLDRIKYYNDSLYSLLPKEDTRTIARDVLASLIDSATMERLSQLMAPTLPPSQGTLDGKKDNLDQYGTIAAAASTSLQVRSLDETLSSGMWIEEKAVEYDSDTSCIGTLLLAEQPPTRVFVGTKTRALYSSYDVDNPPMKATYDRINQLALLLSQPRNIGFATMR